MRYVTLIISVLGFLLASIAFARTVRLERRIILESYLKLKWPELQKQVRTHLDDVSSWLYDLDKGKNEYGYFPIPQKEIPTIKLDDTINRYFHLSTPFDILNLFDLSKEMDSYADLVIDLNACVNNYNDLLDPTTRHYYNCVKLGPFSEWTEDQTEHYRLRNESALRVITKYLGNLKNCSDDKAIFYQNKLKEHPRYRRDIESGEKKIVALLKRVHSSHKRVSDLLSIYSAKFSVEC